jgi:hypothetical protein
MSNDGSNEKERPNIFCYMFFIGEWMWMNRSVSNVGKYGQIISNNAMCLYVLRTSHSRRVSHSCRAGYLAGYRIPLTNQPGSWKHHCSSSIFHSANRELGDTFEQIRMPTFHRCSNDFHKCSKLPGGFIQSSRRLHTHRIVEEKRWSLIIRWRHNGRTWWVKHHFLVILFI